MRVLVFDLGGTLMAYRGMPFCWTDFYEAGFSEVNERYSCAATDSDIERSAEILAAFNPRVNYREIEYSPEYIFRSALAHWKCDIPVESCAYTFYEGLRLESVIYPDVIPVLDEIQQRGIKIAAFTDLPTAMPDDLFKNSITDIIGYFDLYVSSQSCGYRKPNPAGLKLIADYFQVPAKDLVFIGDEEKDRKTAEKFGCRFIHIDRKEKDIGDICDLYGLLDVTWLR